MKFNPCSISLAAMLYASLFFSCASDSEFSPTPSSSSADRFYSSSTAGSSSSSFIGTITSNCDAQTFKTVEIGTQTWMAENLNCNVSGSKCYGNSEANCAIYGRLYNWFMAMAICPSGWHLPTNAEWDKLYRYVDSEKGGSGFAGSCESGTCYDSYTAGKYLKAANGWDSGGNGEDAYGFAALPGGYGSSDGYFHYVGSLGYWWSASEYYADDTKDAYYRYMSYYGGYADWDYVILSGGLLSVRCLQN